MDNKQIEEAKARLKEKRAELLEKHSKRVAEYVKDNATKYTPITKTEQKYYNVALAVEAAREINFDATLPEVAKILGTSPSSVCKHYKEEKFIQGAFKEDTYTAIQDMLQRNRIEGGRKGGQTSSTNFELITPTRNEKTGQFTGSRRR